VAASGAACGSRAAGVEGLPAATTASTVKNALRRATIRAAIRVGY
jgi:hypothetical protein